MLPRCSQWSTTKLLLSCSVVRSKEEVAGGRTVNGGVALDLAHRRGWRRCRFRRGLDRRGSWRTRRWLRERFLASHLEDPTATEMARRPVVVGMFGDLEIAMVGMGRAFERVEHVAIIYPGFEQSARREVGGAADVVFHDGGKGLLPPRIAFARGGKEFIGSRLFMEQFL